MIAEVATLAAPEGLIRIPPEMDVPVTRRVMRVVDSAAMRRLGRISQLGLVSHVYPGAGHSRLEHSLGVYQRSLAVLQHLSAQPRFAALVSDVDAEAFVLAALLHDCGHWPFCHAIEDMRIATVPTHEGRARQGIGHGEIADAIAADWRCDVDAVLRILENRPASDAQRVLHSLISGPIDIDKMDYLIRDSLHAGVPYGRNFDVARLTTSLTIHPDQPRMAITDKGRTAAEMMVFARYVMFSEVYWHHAVRSATAMLQRAVYLLIERMELSAMYDLDEADWIARLRRIASGTAAEPLVEGLYGPRRRLLKRAAQFNVLDQAEQHARLAHRPYSWLADASEALARRLGRLVRMPLGLAEVIIDAPPVKLEVDINVPVLDRQGRPRPLGSVSPVVDALAKRQFDSHVKKVRVFVREDVRDRLPGGQVPEEELRAAIAEAGESRAEVRVVPGGDQ